MRVIGDKGSAYQAHPSKQTQAHLSNHQIYVYHAFLHRYHFCFRKLQLKFLSPRQVRRAKTDMNDNIVPQPNSLVVIEMTVRCSGNTSSSFLGQGGTCTSALLL